MEWHQLFQWGLFYKNTVRGYCKDTENDFVEVGSTLNIHLIIRNSTDVVMLGLIRHPDDQYNSNSHDLLDS